jgi:hypothetical protein
MRHVDDSGAVGPQLPEDRKEPLRLRRAQGCCRFVEDEDAGLGEKSAGERHDLTLGGRQRLHGKVGRETLGEACERGAGRRAGGSPRDSRAAREPRLDEAVLEGGP